MLSFFIHGLFSGSPIDNTDKIFTTCKSRGELVMKMGQTNLFFVIILIYIIKSVCGTLFEKYTFIHFQFICIMLLTFFITFFYNSQVTCDTDRFEKAIIKEQLFNRLWRSNIKKYYSNMKIATIFFLVYCLLLQLVTSRKQRPIDWESVYILVD